MVWGFHKVGFYLNLIYHNSENPAWKSQWDIKDVIELVPRNEHFGLVLKLKTTCLKSMQRCSEATHPKRSLNYSQRSVIYTVPNLNLWLLWIQRIPKTQTRIQRIFTLLVLLWIARRGCRLEKSYHRGVADWNLFYSTREVGLWLGVISPSSQWPIPRVKLNFTLNAQDFLTLWKIYSQLSEPNTLHAKKINSYWRLALLSCVLVRDPSALGIYCATK